MSKQHETIAAQILARRENKSDEGVYTPIINPEYDPQTQMKKMATQILDRRGEKIEKEEAKLEIETKPKRKKAKKDGSSKQ